MSGPELEVESRRRIFRRIGDEPGIHFRALLDDFDHAQGTLQYHLRWPADEGFVDVSDDGKYTRYYPAETFDDVDRTAMNALRRKYGRRILAHLLADGPLSTTERGDRIDGAPRRFRGSFRGSKTPASSRKSATAGACDTNSPTRSA